MVNAAKAYIPAAGHGSKRWLADGFATFAKNLATFTRISCHKRRTHTLQADWSFEAPPIGSAEAGSWR
jgi:hypothetical protein